MSLAFDPQKVWINVRQASTEDLLERVTALRAGLEPEALAIIEEELRGRGVRQEEINNRRDRLEQEALFYADGTAALCSICRRPAIARQWGWQRLWRWAPIFPRLMYYCSEHVPR